MNILILGGTRFLGRHLVKSALDNGHQVTLFNRGSNQDVFPEVERLIGDRDGNLKALRDREWDAVIDTCGFVPRTVRRSCMMLGSVKHYTYISSISVYKDPVAPGIDENGTVQSMDEDKAEELTRDTAGPVYEYYGPLKVLCEQTVEKELPGKVLTVRPGLIVGPYDYSDHFSYWLDRVAKGGEILAPGCPERPIQFIDARDLAEWIIQMVEKKITGTYHAVGPRDVLTMGDLLEKCKEVSVSDAEFTWVSEGYLMENNVGPWMEMPLWIPEEFPLQGQEKPWNGFMAFANSKSVQMGLTFRPLAQTIEDTLIWERQRRADGQRKAGLDSVREKELLRGWHAVLQGK